MTKTLQQIKDLIRLKTTEAGESKDAYFNFYWTVPETKQQIIIFGVKTGVDFSQGFEMWTIREALTGKNYVIDPSELTDVMFIRFDVTHIIKKPGDTITVTLGIGIPADGETWTYGVGCSLIDSAGTSWDFTSFSTIVKGGTTIQSQYMEKNKNYSCIFSAKIPADAAEGLIDVVGAVWKKTKDLTESDRIIDATEEDAYDYQKKTWKMSLSMTVA